jgi:hypothetical protein
MACGSAVVVVTIPSGRETWIDEAAASLTSAVPVEATILGTRRRVLPPGSMEHIYDIRSIYCHAFVHPEFRQCRFSGTCYGLSTIHFERDGDRSRAA